MKHYFLLLVFLFPLLANADDNKKTKIDSLRLYRIPSITVSAARANSSNSPVPYSEITKSEIKDTYSSQDLPQILSQLPSVMTFSENGNFIVYTNLSVRGFDQRRISVMVNGIPQNDPEDHNFYWINLSDFASTIDNIQVQRGAGLSNYGPAAIGGSILLSTVNYANFRGVNISSGIGFQEYGGQKPTEQISNRFAIEYSSGIVDNYAFYAKLGRINSFGYRDDSWANLSSYFFSAMRFDGDLTSQINIYGGSQVDGLAYNGLPKGYVTDPELRRHNYSYFSYDKSDGKTVNWTTSRRKQEVEVFSQPQFELLNDWRISNNFVFKSALFLKMGEGYFDYDGTGWTNANSFRLTPENGFIDAEDPNNPIIRAYVGNKYGGWIPRLELDNSLGKLMVGAEIRIHRSEHWGKIEFAENLPENFNPDYKFYSYDGVRNIISAFASQQFDVTDKISINTEAQIVNHLYGIENEKAGNIYTQYNQTDGTVVGNGDRLFSINHTFFNPRVGLNYIINDYQRTYFSAAYTSREPRMRNLYPASDSWDGATPIFENVHTNDTILYNFSKPLIKPERMLNLELGWSLNIDDFKVNINGYLMEYFDELVKSGMLDLFGSPIDGNAAKTRHYGVEIEAAKVIFESNKTGILTISTNATFSNNTIIDYNFATKSGETIQLEGNQIAGFPDIMTNLKLTYSFSNLFSSIHLRYIGEFRTDNFGDMHTTDSRIKSHLGSSYYSDNIVEAYTTVNFDIGYAFENILTLNKLRIHLQVNNLTNELYAASGIGREFFPAAGRNYFLGFELGL